METQIYKATTLECHIFLTLHCKVGMDNGEIISKVQLQYLTVNFFEHWFGFS